MLGLHHSTGCKAEELTATIQPGLHHTAMKWHFLASESLLFGLFYFFPHTHHTTYTGMHWLLVTTQENERKVRKSLRKRRKTCGTIIVGNRTCNLLIGNRCTYHCTIWDTHTHTHTHGCTCSQAHTHCERLPPVLSTHRYNVTLAPEGVIQRDSRNIPCGILQKIKDLLRVPPPPPSTVDPAMDSSVVHSYY